MHFFSFTYKNFNEIKQLLIGPYRAFYLFICFFFLQYAQQLCTCIKGLERKLRNGLTLMTKKQRICMVRKGVIVLLFCLFARLTCIADPVGYCKLCSIDITECLLPQFPNLIATHSFFISLSDLICLFHFFNCLCLIFTTN